MALIRQGGSRVAGVALAGLTVLVAGRPAAALINPNFTPNDLVEQSSTILVVRLGKPDARNRLTARVIESIKGKNSDETVVIDLSTASQKAWAERVGRLAAARGDQPVPLFIGTFVERTDDEFGGEPFEGALLQIDRDWVLLDPPRQGGTWEMWQVDATKQGTWDGGSDMLIRAVRYLKDHEDDRVPVAVGCTWRGSKTIGRVPGSVFGARAVDLDGTGQFALFITSSEGDRLFEWDPAKQAFADVSKARRLTSASLAATWADFNGDGRLDLASSDGASLALHVHGESGGFETKMTVAVPGGVLGLDAADCGVRGRAGILAGTAKMPVLLVPDAGGGGYVSRPLLTGSVSLASLGRSSRCVLADFDNDGFADVVQPFERGGLIYRGRGKGTFESARKTDVATGKGAAVTCAGDFDADGQLDICMVGAYGVALWVNEGGLRFSNRFGHSGEMCYTAQPGGTDATACDINNDGLQDLLIAYGTDHPHHYFNRGFLSLGKSLSLIWENDEVLANTKAGQQAATVADFNGDGGQDMALVLSDGTVMVYLREVVSWDDSEPLSARAMLTARCGSAGPITVTGWNHWRPLGARLVTAGSTGALFGLAEPGPVRLQWRFAKGQVQQETVEVKERPVRLELCD